MNREHAVQELGYFGARTAFEIAGEIPAPPFTKEAYVNVGEVTTFVFPSVVAFLDSMEQLGATVHDIDYVCEVDKYDVALTTYSRDKKFYSKLTAFLKEELVDDYIKGNLEI